MRATLRLRKPSFGTFLGAVALLVATTGMAVTGRAVSGSVEVMQEGDILAGDGGIDARSYARSAADSDVDSGGPGIGTATAGNARSGDVTIVATGNIRANDDAIFAYSIADIYDGDDKIAEYKTYEPALAAMVGSQLSRFGEIRLGVVRGLVRARPTVGDVSLPVLDEPTGAWVGRLVIDRLNDTDFPTKGVYFRLGTHLSRRKLGSDFSYDKLAGEGPTDSQAQSFGQQLKAGISDPHVANPGFFCNPNHTPLGPNPNRTH